MSMSESSLSQASTKVSDETKEPENSTPGPLKAVKHGIHSATTQDILLFLVAFRILNALTIRTFFQPDEYFQSLEPAWQMAFGEKSGAWITWVGAVCRWAQKLLANNQTGMEEPSEIRYPSCNIRSHLLDF
jgi:hypothetical protein